MNDWSDAIVMTIGRASVGSSNAALNACAILGPEILAKKCFSAIFKTTCLSLPWSEELLDALNVLTRLQFS